MHTKRLITVLLPALLLLLAACNDEQPQTDYTNGEANSEESLADTSARDADPSDGPLRVVVLGNSIAAGYGVGQDRAFPALVQDKVDERGWNVEIVNAGVSGETTAGGLRRLDWVLSDPVDVLIIELGGNDGLRGTPVETTRENLEAMIEKTRENDPDTRIILAGMQLPPNLGREYTERFREIYPQIAEEKDTELIPFVLEGVGGNPELNQPDGIHPTAEGQRIVAENVWEVLEPVLQEMLAEHEMEVAE